MEHSATITVESIIYVPIKKVWHLWTEPVHIQQWNNASPDWHTPHASNDLRPGGSFVFRMEAKDGSFGFDFTGVYEVVSPYSQIAYTLADGRKVNILFASQGNNTHLVETFDPESINPHHVQKGGWQAILNNFKTYAESIP